MPISKTQAQSLLEQALDKQSVSFHPGQWEAIDSLVNHKARLLVVQRTGWGKSIVYFIATHILRKQGSGPSLLISPLLALMRNQILAAKNLGLNAATINSSNPDDWEEIFAEIKRNQVDILLVSPERLANEKFRDDTLRPILDDIGLFVVDEAHCISDWGHDFRPDYQRISRILQALPPNIPILATTATANNRVVEDVVQQFGDKLEVIRGPLARESLQLQNIHLPSKAERLAWLAEQLPSLPGSGIIYTLTIRDAQRVAEWLKLNNIDAFAYWGGLASEEREILEGKLLNDQIKVLVATSALGMGFDKPNIGFVIHFQRPGSLVHYYQQVGRAGRKIPNAYGVLLCGEEDDEIIDYFINSAFPPEGHTLEILDALNQAEDGLSFYEIQIYVNLSYSQIEKVLKALSVKHPSPVAKTGRKWYATPAKYTPDLQKVNNILETRHREQEQIQEYIMNEQCLMAFIRKALDDTEAENCGRCAVCQGKYLLPISIKYEKVNQAITYLKRSYQPIEPRKLWPGYTLADYGWTGRIAQELSHETGRALCIWGDAGWGDLVKKGKQEDGHFHNDLVNASANLIQNQWKPTPSPAWVTCVASLKRPKLVSDFAARLAEKLSLPFVPCIEKIRDTQPQKTMRNSSQQSRNLMGAFQINPWDGINGPVLLVDDMVDSRWTITILSALLQEMGSGPVFPYALALVHSGGS